MDLFVSAGEASSDLHCACLIRELKSKTEISSFGLGGDSLAQAGTRLLLHNRELAGAGGPVEMLSQIPKRRALERALGEIFAGRPPQGAILVDTGEINLRLAPMLRLRRVPVVYFIPPKVWVWRASRLKTIARNVDLVLSILPFEEPIYASRGIPFQYVGNPLLDEVPHDLTEQAAKTALGIDPAQPVVAVLPGSRHNEIRLQLGHFVEAIGLFLTRIPQSEQRPLIIVPAAPAIEPASIVQAFEARLPGAAVKVVKGQNYACIKSARAALIKSGTSTMEAALLQVPMVLAYHSSRSSEWVFRHIVRYRGFVGLVNLFLEPDTQAALGVGKTATPVVPEMILARSRPDLIADELMAIYRDGPARTTMLSALSRTRALLAPPPGLGVSPIAAAANAAWALFERKGVTGRA